MPRFQIAHIQEQGQDIIMVFVDPSFEYTSEEEQQLVMGELQQRANAAGLRGIVVPAWQRNGIPQFRGPIQWRAFFNSLTWANIVSQVNRELYW